MEAPQSTVAIDGAALAFLERGAGSVTVLVHGSISDHRSWLGQIDPFARYGRVVAYSRRWHWPNSPPTPRSLYEAERHAADLAGLIERLGAAPAHVVGSSYGAMIALSCAALRPELFRSLVLGEPPLLPWLSQLPGGADLLHEFLANVLGPAGMALSEGRSLDGIRLFVDGVIGPGVFDQMPPPVRQTALDNVPALRAEAATPPERYFPALVPEQLAAFALPVLLVQGEWSPPMFTMITDELARVLPQATRVTIEQASHGMHVQQPSAYNAAVLGFLNGL